MAPLDRSTDLETIRLLDWRLLLPDPDLRDAACLTPADAPLRAALAQLAPSARLGSVAEVRAGDANRYRVVVVPQDARATVGELISLLAPGGWVYVHCSGRQVKALRRSLERAGFDRVIPLWHWPDVRRATRIAPLDRRGLRRAVEAGRGATTRGARQLIATLLSHLGLIPRFGGEVAVLARYGPGQGPLGSGLPILGFLSLDLCRFGLSDSASWLLLTPRFVASRHVILLAWSTGEAPALVAKVDRLASEGEGLRREARALELLASTEEADRRLVPRVVMVGEIGSHAVLVETGLAGTPLDRPRVRRDPRGWIAAANEWLVGMPSGQADSAAWREPLDALLAATSPGTPGHALARATLEVLEPLSAVVGRVFEHGDFAHPNLLVSRDGTLGAIDWEESSPDGLPLHDLIFFVAYVAFAVYDPTTPEGHVRAFERLLTVRHAAAAKTLRAHAAQRGLEPELIAPLILACWARYAAGLARRQHGASGLGDTAISRLATNRYYHLWRYALDRQQRLARILATTSP